MIPVDQTIFEHGEGNCFSACLASILECGIEDVVKFPSGDARNWRVLTNDWLYGRGLHFIEVGFDEEEKGETSKYWGYHIICGKSPRGGNVRHAVVGYDGEMVFDPHPSRAGLDGDLSYGFLVSVCKK